MKPNKNRVICPDCGKQKMFFESEKKANNFIKWNGNEIDTHGGELRAYYCPSCCGWHISSKMYKKSYDTQTDRLIGAYKRTSKASKTSKTISTLLGKPRKNINFDKISKNIWNSIPNEVKNVSSRGIIKKYVKKYFEKHGITDDVGGKLIVMVYNLWYEHNYLMFHK